MKRESWSIEQYHASPAISSGMIRCFATEGALRCYHRYVKRDMPIDETVGWKRLGTGLHLGMQDPQLFEDSIVVIPEAVPDSYAPEMVKDAEIKSRSDKFGDGESVFNGRWDRHKVWLDEQAKAAMDAGKIFLSFTEADSVRQQINALWANPACREFIGDRTKDNTEVAVTTTCSETGMELKALADILLPGVIVDYKSTRHTTLDRFVRDAIAKGYLWQSAHYSRVCECSRTVVIAVTKEYPFESFVIEWVEPMILEAAESNRFVLRQIRNCFDTNSWHSPEWGHLNVVGGAEPF